MKRIFLVLGVVGLALVIGALRGDRLFGRSVASGCVVMTIEDKGLLRWVNFRNNCSKPIVVYKIQITGTNVSPNGTHTMYHNVNPGRTTGWTTLGPIHTGRAWNYNVRFWWKYEGSAAADSKGSKAKPAPAAAPKKEASGGRKVMNFAPGYRNPEKPAGCKPCREIRDKAGCTRCNCSWKSFGRAGVCTDY